MDLTASRRSGLILVFLSTLAWSTAGLFTRAITADYADVLVWRGLFGTLGLLAVLLLREGPGGLSGFRRLGWAGWAYALISGASLLAYIAALRLTSIAHVAIIYATVPFMAAGLGWLLLGEKPSASAVIASVLALLGAVVMVGLGDDGTALGDLLALAMTFGMALLIVIARRSPRIPTLPAGMLSTFLTMLIALPFATPHLPAPDQLLLLAGFGLANSTLGFSMFLLGSARIPAIETALLGALEAPIAPVWVWAVFGETPAPATILGGAIVLAAVFWHISRQYRA